MSCGRTLRAMRGRGFFFQAEDGIRGRDVTGVQTCALPIFSGFMSGLGGIVLASRLQSVDLNAGGSTLLIDAISAAVIGGTSLFGGRGEVRNALIEIGRASCRERG